MEHIELRELIAKCVNGQINICKPLILTSRDRSQTTSISFLNHLLKHNGIKPEKIFTFYFQVLNIFNKSYEKLMNNSVFNAYVQHVKKEWDISEFILYRHELLLDRQKNTVEELLENMNILCRQFRELNSKVRTNNMTDVIVEDEMLEGMDTFLDKVRELGSEIEEISNILDPIIDEINKLNICVLLDLSMKDKSLYLEFSEVDDDINIPENINISFLNYVYIINLIKKHVIYYRRILSKVKEISGNMNKYVEDSRDTIQSKDNLFSLNRQQGDIDAYLDDLESVISYDDIGIDNSEYDTQMMAPAGVEE